VAAAVLRLTVGVRRDPDRGFTTPREAEGVDRINAATRPQGRGGGGVCSGCPSGRLKVVAVVFARLVNTPATLGNWGGWFRFNHPTTTAAMGFLLLSVILMFSFAWMWNRNDKVKKRLKRLKVPVGIDHTAFGEWRKQTRKRTGQADAAALLATAIPCSVFIPVLPVLLFVPALVLAFKSNAAGRLADRLAEQIGFEKGVDWLIAKPVADQE
jgi:hypothetical protein